MAQQNITIGTADAGNGDTLFAAFTKVEANFTELYSDDAGDVGSIIQGDGIAVDQATGDVTVSVADNGIDHDKLSNSYTQLSDLGTGTAFAIDFDTATTFTATANGAATLTMSNAQQGQVVDVIMGIGDFAITLAETGSTFNKVGTTVYDGTTNNIIQIICTDDTSGSKIYHYAVSTYTAGATV